MPGTYSVCMYVCMYVCKYSVCVCVCVGVCVCRTIAQVLLIRHADFNVLQN